MKKILINSLFFVLFAFSPVAFAENGNPDPTPTPAVNCGGLPCSYYAGKYFSLSNIDDNSFAEIQNIGQYCMPPSKPPFVSCRTIGKNAIPSNNLNKVIFNYGWVGLTYPQKWDTAISTRDITPPEYLSMKITLSGTNAEFGQYPIPNFTFSNDRRTVYIKAHRILTGTPETNGLILQIIPKSVGKIIANAYLETGVETYSDTPIESAQILVISKYDEFVFKLDKKTRLPIASERIQKKFTCIMGKSTKTILTTDLYRSDCPKGFKIKS